MKVYKDFHEIAEEVANNTPPVIYKFREWGNKYHESVIKNLELWFAHPFQLNDPYDLRPPYKFNVDNIDWSQVENKIREAGKKFEPYLSSSEFDINVAERLAAIKEDPIAYFMKNRENSINDDEFFNRIGIISCCLTYDNASMWANYGNKNSGFAVGFHTLELSKQIESSFGYVIYDDNPIEFNIMGDNSGFLEKVAYSKSIAWEQEKEFRYVTMGINLTRSRDCKFDKTAVAEIVLGVNVTKEVEQEIIREANITLSGVPIYKLKRNIDSFGFNKVLIN